MHRVRDPGRAGKDRMGEQQVFDCSGDSQAAPSGGKSREQAATAVHDSSVAWGWHGAAGGLEDSF